MGKTKKYTLRYWVKNNGPDDLAKVIEQYHAGEDIPVQWDGSLVDFANELYKEWGKKGHRCQQWFPAFYPTPLDVGRQMAEMLNLEPGQTVLDPGCGFGNLAVAVRMVEPQAKIVTAEIGLFQRRVAKCILGAEPDIHDFLECQTVPAPDAVIANPPYGNIFGHNAIEVDFLNKIADVCAPGTRVVAVLPGQFRRKERPKAYVQARERFTLLDEEELPPETFHPLTAVNTSIFVLRVDDGKSKVEMPPTEEGAGCLRHTREVKDVPIAKNFPEGDTVINLPGDGDLDLDKELCAKCHHPLSEHKMAGKGAQRHEVCMVPECHAHELWVIRRGMDDY